MSFFTGLFGNGYDRIINTPGQHKDLICKKCECVTDHVSITWEEFDEVELSPLERVAYRVLGDLNPGANIVGGRPFQCMRCSTKRSI
jgi:hypothetical protein